MPARTRDVRAYLLERADAGRSIATLRADDAGIAAVHRAAGQRGPCEPRGAGWKSLRLPQNGPKPAGGGPVGGVRA